MSHILKRKINNVIYVYQEKSYRDKLGRPRTKQKCLGKLDNNGVLILSRKRNPKNLPGVITQYKLTITKFRIKAITDSHKESKENKESKTQSHNNAQKIFTNSSKATPISQYTNSHKIAHYQASYMTAYKLAQVVRKYQNIQHTKIFAFSRILHYHASHMAVCKLTQARAYIATYELAQAPANIAICNLTQKRRKYYNTQILKFLKAA